MHRDCLPTIVLAVLLTLSSAHQSYAGGGPKNILLVINDSSPVSVSIGEYYKAKRNIPDRNVCHITCSTNESVDKTECENNIVIPIRNFINNTGIHNRIDYIVLTKGIPLRASYYDATSNGPLSVSSLLACVGVPTITSMCTNPYGPTAYPTAPSQYFSHQLVFSSKSYYVVARLDSYTEDQVHSMIDDAVAARSPGGMFVLDGRYESSATTEYGKANNRLRLANHDLVTAGYSTYYDDTTFDSQIHGLAGGAQDVMGYFSWGSNEPEYTLPVYLSNIFRPGSIADSYSSTSARSLVYPPVYGQSLIADLIPQGLTVANGYVSEPDVRYASYPGMLFSRYTQGYNAGESFFAATPKLYWKSALFGDPLVAPYATPPDVSITSPDPINAVYGTVTISASASDTSGIKKVEFYVNDVLMETVTTAPYHFHWDTTTCVEDSVCTVEAIAYENSSVCTQGLASAHYRVQNAPIVVSSISQLADMPLGTLVRLLSKVVIAGSDAFADCIYVAEMDRSHGIRVMGSFEVGSGSIVEIVGVVGTADGERVLTSAVVIDSASILRSVRSTGDDAMRPLMMANKYVANRGHNTSPEYSALNFGLSNCYLLVQTSGKVVSVGTDEFCISDGSMETKKSIIRNIKVSLKNLTSPMEIPPLNSRVFVIGISCLATENGLKRPVIRPRVDTDIVLIPM